MATSFTWQDEDISFTDGGGFIFRATSGGTVFSSNLAGETNFDLFDDTSVVDDAIYFCRGLGRTLPVGIRFHIGTALSATSIELAWEYYRFTDNDFSTGYWADIEDLEDDTNSFQNTGTNTVKFPLQWQSKVTVVNGVNNRYFWMRCRIKSISGLTEGGANAGSEITCGQGYLTVSGSSTEPTSFEEIYDWIKTNKSYINITKSDDGNTYDFRKIMGKAIHLTSNNEIVKMGQNTPDNMGSGGWYFQNFKSGTRLGDRGVDGSTFIVFGTGNSGVVSFQYSQNELYGFNLLSGGYLQTLNRFPGYCIMGGTFVDCIFEVNPNFNDAVEFTNHKFKGGFVIFSYNTALYNNFTYVANVGYMFFLAPLVDTTDITGFDWEMNGGGHMFYPYTRMYRAETGINLIDPKKPLPDKDDPDVTIVRNIFDLEYDLEKVFFYNSTADTYTDYTTEASDTDLDDVPLHGEVGDTIYLAQNKSPYSYSIFPFVGDNPNNDYEYKVQYYDTTNAWVDADPYFYDSTDNFSNDGFFGSPTLGGSPTGTAGYVYMKKITINGFEAYWFRVVITKKGTGTPTATQIRYKRAFAAAPWFIRQIYTANLTIIDEDGTAISGANVILKDSDDTEVWNVNTDVDGEISEQILQREVKFSLDDPDNSYISDIEFGNYTVEVSADGYESYSTKLVEITEPFKTKIALKEAVPIMISPTDAYVKTNPENIGEGRDLIV